jgi:di/tricarboxylate transporter
MARYRLLAILSAVLFVLGAIADASSAGTVFSQSPTFWLLLGLAAAVLAVEERGR